MFVIYKSWYDCLTSMREPDFGYALVGYVNTKKEAEFIVNNGGNNPHYYKKEPMYKHTQLKYFETSARQPNKQIKSKEGMTKTTKFDGLRYIKSRDDFIELLEYLQDEVIEYANTEAEQRHIGAVIHSLSEYFDIKIKG